VVAPAEGALHHPPSGPQDKPLRALGRSTTARQPANRLATHATRWPA
jgi:hypothetical protein